MKKLIALIAALALIVGCLAACGGSGSGSDTASDSVDLKALLDKINNQYSLSDLKVLENASDLNRYYSVNEADVKQFAAELTTAASQYNEVIIIETASADAVDSVKNMLAAHLDAQLNTAKSYDKDAVAMIEGCNVQTIGQFVYLVIGENASGINQMIKDYIQ